MQNLFQENALMILYQRKWEHVLPLSFLHVWKIFPETERQTKPWGEATDFKDENDVKS